MIAELTAAMTAIRKTAQLKLMTAKTQAEVNAAIGELNSKLRLFSANACLWWALIKK